MVRVLLILIAALPSNLCFVPWSRAILRQSIQRRTESIHFSSKSNYLAHYYNDKDDDEITVIQLDEAFISADQSLVAACEFSDRFGPDNEILTVDGDRIMYRNGCFRDNEWIPHYGRPIPYSYSTQVPLLDEHSDDLVIDKSGFAWRAEHVLKSEGMTRYNMVPSESLVRQEQNVSIPTPWSGPMDIPPQERGLGPNMKLREDEAFTGSLLDDERWMVYYTKLADFLSRVGHADVPLDWQDDPPLCRWVVKQRTNYRRYARNNYYQYEILPDGGLGRKITELSPWRIQMLYDLGFSFKINLSWDDRFKQILAYYDRHGDIDVPPENTDGGEGAEYPGLHLWVQSQRSENRSYQEGMPSTMTRRRFVLLDALGINWSPNENLWAERIESLKAYRDQNGHLRVRRSENYELANWLKHQRQQYKLYESSRWQSRLTPERIRQLDELGMDWDPLEARWQWNFDALAGYAAEHGHCKVPVCYDKDAQLALWVRKQRQAKRRGIMSPDKEAQLTSLGFVFETYNEMFERGFDKLKSYQDNHGDCAVPLLHEDKVLVAFVVSQRNQYREKRKGKVSALTDERQERLEELGFIWKVDVNEGAWDFAYAKLKEFVQENGHADVPSNYEDGVLYRFVNTQRSEYRKWREGQSKSSLTAARVAKLEKIGFAWNTNDARWGERFDELQAFREGYGHCNVPDKYESNRSLATWVRNQRSQYKKLQSGENSTMTESRIAALESIGFEWSVKKRQKDRVKL
jgi:hypothetical protein